MNGAAPARLKSAIRRIPVVGYLAARIYQIAQRLRKFSGSGNYWETRYRRGGNSGSGSYNRLAAFKSDILNRFVLSNDIEFLIEYGCGDGNQLALSNYRKYLGFDVSATAVSICKAKFAADESKQFRLMDAYSGDMSALTLSLDVIYHLVEDEVFEHYMRRLFDSSTRFVIIYSSNMANSAYTSPHVKHRDIGKWIDAAYPDWHLMETIKNPFPYSDGDPDNTSFADFFIYRRHLATSD